MSGEQVGVGVNSLGLPYSPHPLRFSTALCGLCRFASGLAGAQTRSDPAVTPVLSVTKELWAPPNPPHLSGLLLCRQTRPLVPDMAPGSWASACQQEGVARGGGRGTRARELHGCSGELCVSLRIPGESGPGSCVSANPRVCDTRG